jgi:hypothetical protein
MKILKRINLIVAIVMWSLALMFGLFNLLGLWKAWHLAGYAWLVCVLPSLALSVITLIASFVIEDWEYTKKENVLRSGIVLMISVGISLLAGFIFAAWFW